MNVFNGSTFRSSAPTTYGFEPGHVFAIKEGFDEVLYKHISHDRHVLTASPLANPELRQVFPQEDLRELVQAGKLDPRIEQNKESRQKLLARSPDIKSVRDLPDDDQNKLAFYWQLCRHVVQMYEDGKTSLTDKALRKVIPKVMLKLEYGVDLDEDDSRPGSGERKIRARKSSPRQDPVSPSTVRGWIRKLEQHEWDSLALAEVGKLDGPNAIHDTTRVIADAVPRLRSLMDAAEHRAPSRFERYLLGRLDGKATGSWLDGLPMFAAVHLPFVAGAVAVHGPGVVLDDLGDDEAWRCEAAGFEIVDKGAEGIRAFLDELQAPFRDSRSPKGPKVMYGRLYEWLAHECRDSAYDPVRDIIVDHSLDTLGLGPGDVLFGRKVAMRRKHSVVSAAKEFGLHPKRMRKMLQRANLTGADLSGAANNRVTFDATEAETLLKGLAESISMEKLREYMNVPRPHDRGLMERGFIKPLMAGGRAKGGHAFLKSDLDVFLERLLRDADPALHGDPDMVPLIAAAKHSCCAVMDVVTLVVNGQLSRVGRDPGQAGFVSVLVDAEEVRPLVTGPAYEGHSLRDLEKLLSAGTYAVKALVEKGFIIATTVKNPVTGWMQPIVRDEDLQRFRQEYVSLHTLARERGEHFARVKKSLVAVGVVPVGDPDELKQTLYRRSDIP